MRPFRDLWARLRAGFALPEQEHPRIERARQWFASHQEYLDRITERARLYLHHLVEEAERRSLPTELTLLPVVESAFQPFAYSPSHAAGLWQFVPATARKYGLKQNWWYDGRRDVVASTRAAFDYLERLHAEFSGDWLLAVAAYNAGEGTVHRAIRRNLRSDEPTDFWSLRLPRETRNYVPRFLAVVSIVRTPGRYGLTLDPIPNIPYFERVELDSQIDLTLAARLAEMALDDLYLLNPGFNRWATDPDGPHRLLLPVDRAGDFADRLDELPAEERVTWRRHRIRKGETLGGIARRYRTRVSVLQRLNELRGTLIRAGDHLIVPAPARADDAAGTPTRTAAGAAGASGRARVHDVRRGDTLWDIARRYGVSVRTLAARNGISEGTILRVGQQLKVGGAAAPTESPADGFADPSLLDGIATRRVRYTVRRGDSLWAIARRFGVSVEALRRWNDLRIHEYLQPGQRLDLYVDPRRYTDPS